MTRQTRSPGPDHPIRLETGKIVSISLGDDVLAAKADAVMVYEANYQPVAYVAAASIANERMTPSATRTWCPYKGEASYYSLVTDTGKILTDAIWCYENPAPAVAEIQGRLAFYPDRVKVEAV